MYSYPVPARGVCGHGANGRSGRTWSVSKVRCVSALAQNTRSSCRFGCAGGPGRQRIGLAGADRHVPGSPSCRGAMPGGHPFQVLDGRTEPCALREMLTGQHPFR